MNHAQASFVTISDEAIDDDIARQRSSLALLITDNSGPYERLNLYNNREEVFQ
ncbi:hypothetical protein [Paenibacillus sp. Y412MC10]|uniref:hypothetical protein n=1 Tax=Geobacillus sp. (strain Y412MC10) TaxID=481743 RepID=UPI001642B15B|nr:hypothetical protein [Paenibacillus sp. Y412MC10]